MSLQQIAAHRKLSFAYIRAGLTVSQASDAAHTSLGTEGYEVKTYTDHAAPARSIHSY